MKYVSLACDANPSYATYAPIVARIWRRMGFEPILFIHNTGWDTEFGRHVMINLDGFLKIPVPRIEPLSVGNTMRVSRLAAAALTHINDDDLIITADIDMAPLKPAFYSQVEPPFVLRGDMYGSFPGCASLLHDGTPALICAMFRFPLCYIGLRAEHWRRIMPIVPGDPTETIRAINHGLRCDSVEHDEACTSARLLTSVEAHGPLKHVVGDRWQQGSLNLISQTNWPGGWPMRMLIHGEGQHFNPESVDFHMPRPIARWTGEALGRYWPDDAAFFRAYWNTASLITEMTQ